MTVKKKLRETGSSSLTVLTVVGTATASMFYLSSITEMTRTKIAEEKQRQASEVADIGTLNSVSRYKALLAPRKGDDGAHIPGLFASDYYASVWQLRANPQLQQSQANFDSNDRTVKIKSIGNQQLGINKVESVLKGVETATNLVDTLSDITVVKTHFKADYRVAESLEVEVRTQKENNQFSTRKRFRVPLQTPVPSDPVIEVSPAGKNSFTGDFSKTLKPGLYDIRVLASGVAYDADILVNGVKIGTVGGFNPVGRITHSAITPIAKNQEIGRIHGFEFTGGDSNEGTGDNLLCKFNAAAVNEGEGVATFELSASVRGPNSGDVITSEAVTVNLMSKEQADDHEYSIEELANACNKREQCPYFGPLDREDPVDPLWGWILEGNFSDATSYHNMVTNATAWGIKNRKLCVNFENARTAFYAANGRNPADLVEFVPQQSLFDFVYYHPKSCKRTFLFQRNGCGCFASDTKILLGDGMSEKAISDLQETDTVWNPILKKEMPIRRMTRGPEHAPMIRIVANGETLLVTGNHPFPTADGHMKAAHTFRKNDGIRTADGAWVRVESVETVPIVSDAPIVWNLEVEAPDADWVSHQVVANGIVTGDLVIQKQLQNGR